MNDSISKKAVVLHPLMPIKDMNYLFTTPSCPNCPRAKETLLKSDLEVQVVDASTPEGLDLAKQHQVMQVPSLILQKKNGQGFQSFHGLEKILAYLNKV